MENVYVMTTGTGKLLQVFPSLEAAAEQIPPHWSKLWQPEPGRWHTRYKTSVIYIREMQVTDGKSDLLRYFLEDCGWSGSS